jgi:hypothetical protein
LQGKKRLERDHVEWIEIPVSPIIEQWLFDAAEKRFKENLEHMRQNPKYTYLLSGRVWCGCCGHCYAGETHKAGVGRRKTTIQTYRHRESIGHCLNREIKAEYLESAVWEQVVAILKDPKTLRRGYEESLEQQKITHARQQGYLETLYQNKTKLEQAQNNLNAAYIDPDVPLSRKEYIAQKNRIDNELSQVLKEIEETQRDLVVIPSPAELDTLEAFAIEINSRLSLSGPTLEDKSKILNFLHIKVIVETNGDARMEGWFAPQQPIDGKLNLRYPYPAGRHRYLLRPLR